MSVTIFPALFFALASCIFFFKTEAGSYHSAAQTKTLKVVYGPGGVEKS